MESAKQSKVFDEVAKEAMEFLLENFWVLRERDPETYQMVREREQVLRTWFLEKMGYRLVVHRHFAKLEKIPAIPEVWMGIQSFKHPRDYAIFCCLLAFLEGKSVDEQFLLSELCEEIQSLYPGDPGLDWTHYEHRKSLVRVLQFATGEAIVKVVDGDIEQFHYVEDSEVLYEVPIVSRYFMRTYPKDLFQFTSKEEILAGEWDTSELETGVRRRHRVYRQLFLSPVLYSEGTDDPDFLYLRNYRNRIREDIEKHTDFQFELYKNAALLTTMERKTRLTLFPDNKAIMDIALQFANIVREEREKVEVPLQLDGSLRLTWVDFERWVDLCRQRFEGGWSKQYREATTHDIARDLYELLEEWKMAATDPETGILSLQPLLVRTIGRYPKDFIMRTEECVDQAADVVGKGADDVDEE
jgi:uncharacterized protein (TIGR02678 family)